MYLKYIFLFAILVIVVSAQYEETKTDREVSRDTSRTLNGGGGRRGTF